MSTRETNRVIAYLRVSTEEQARSGLGLEAQRTRIADEASRRGWELTWAIDDGYTGSNLDRPALLTSLASLRSGDAAALVVSKLDRLSRSLLDFASLMATAKSEGWALVALDLGIDMTSAQGALMANVLASFAEFERQLCSQRTTEALAALRESGAVLGRPRVVSASTAQRIGRWRAAGCTWQAIADALNEAGVPTAHGGARWYASTARQVLASYERNVA